jgi:ABC-type amino acid transport system permease subunit
MSDQMVQALVLPAMFFAIAWIVWIISNNKRRQRLAEVQKDMQARLFDKFGTSQEMIAYLNSEAGAKFLSSASIEHTKPFARVLGSVQAGLILFFLGVAMLFVRFTMPGVGRDPIEHMQNAHMFLALSFLLLALGLGFLASAGVSYKLSKQWGLFDREFGSKR